MPKVVPQAVKVEAVELVRSGVGVRQAANAVGVGRSTVSREVQSAGVVVPNRTPLPAIAANRERFAAARAQMAETTAELAQKAYDRAGQAIEDGDGTQAKAFAVTGAILTDKHLLLTGEATSRTERSVSPDEQRLRVAELLATLEARRLEQSPPSS